MSGSARAVSAAASGRGSSTLKVHWVPFHVTGEALKKAFEHYGEVKEVRQDEWKDLRRLVLVVVPGRAPICLRPPVSTQRSHQTRLQSTEMCAVSRIRPVTGSRQHEEEGLELMEEEVNDKVTASLETQAEQGARDAEKAATPAASTKDNSTSRKQKQSKTKGEVRTESAPERLDQECDAMKEEMGAESETPYETPDDTVTEEPATPAKRSRSDATDEETLEGSVQRLEPHWMAVRSTRAKKGKHVPAQRSASLTRGGQAAMQ
ncbi:hypothetical protein HPB50_013251 [Hyalomma asiaticum]|uniref:Uncharacterized protein n=1 Tax=Hyalomma asiaticum TaxID=266040 RepID=A0ACB7RNX6_HYAAI|nr:hypothetical protein HPB50_013251 [Hyalomma asiaticum]